MIATLLTPKPVWLTLFLGNLALTVAVLGGVHAGLDFWGLLSILWQLLLGLVVLTVAVALTWQHTETSKSGLSVLIGFLVCLHSLALVLGSFNGA